MADNIENLRLDPCADYLIHQLEIAILARVFVVLVGGHFTTVAEVVAFVNNDKVVVAPVDVFEVETVALPGLTRKVGMIENIVTQAVCNKRIV